MPARLDIGVCECAASLWLPPFRGSCLRDNEKQILSPFLSYPRGNLKGFLVSTRGSFYTCLSDSGVTMLFWSESRSRSTNSPLDIIPLILCMKTQAQKHNAPLVALDFSEDSNYVQSASEDNELLYRGCSPTASHVCLVSFFLLRFNEVNSKLEIAA